MQMRRPSLKKIFGNSIL